MDSKPSPTHHCHARGCRVPVPPEMLMCRRHWMLVPAGIRRRVWEHYRPGQCDDKRPSEAWHVAADDAIKAVFLAERQLAPETQIADNPPDLVFLDTETTGPVPDRHHLLEIALARLAPDASACLDRYTAKVLLPPRAEVQARALEVNGYDPFGEEWRAIAKPLPQVMERVRSMLAGKPIVVAHGVPFDLGFIRVSFRRAGIDMPILGGTCCTVTMARRLRRRGGLPGASLEALSVHFGAVGRAHCASGDVCRLTQVFWALKHLQQEYGNDQEELHGQREACGR